MSCPSDDELAGLALGLIDGADLDLHLKECGACRASMNAMRSLSHQLSEAHKRFETGHEQARTRLLAALPTTQRPVSVNIRTRLVYWIRALTVRERLALTCGFVAVLLASIALWASLAANRLSAMEKMAENIRQAKSYTMMLTFEIKYNNKPDEPNKPLVTDRSTSKVSWLAPNSVRMDDTGFDGRKLTTIRPAGKPGIEIDHRAKTFEREPATRNYASALMVVDKLGDFSGSADRKLGEKQINGKYASGFEIHGLKIDPESYPGPVQIWLDAETSLPVYVHYQIKASASPEMTLIMEGFQWNIELDPTLFPTTAPAGYAEVRSKPYKTADYVMWIRQALKTFAEVCGGHYPRITRTFAEPVRDEMFKAAGLSYPPTTKQMNGEAYLKVSDAEARFNLFNVGVMMPVDADAAYYGKTVGPKDKYKVLLRWKGDDGKYQVIFGDLHVETATLEQVRALEAK